MTVQINHQKTTISHLCIEFTDRLHPSYTVDQYLKCLKSQSSSIDSIQFNFSKCEKAFPNSLLPILCEYKILQRGGMKCTFVPPNNSSLRKIFETTGVLNQFDPKHFEPPTSASDRHLAIVHLKSADAQHRSVSETIDLLMRSTSLNASILDAFRWAYNEISGNIFDHSNSNIGGFVQLDIHHATNRLALCVCDPGDGILKSIKSAGLHHNITGDLEAIQHAIRRGFTSNPEKNQGNGLAGSLGLAKAFKGRLAVRSGSGLMVWENNSNTPVLENNNEAMYGTMIDLQMDMNLSIDNIGEIITGEPETSYEPYSVITDGYLDLESNTLTISMKDETFGFGNRQAGIQMYNKCKNLTANSQYNLTINWTDVPLIASSYADEFIGKLYADIGPIDFSTKVNLIGMDRTTKHILNSVMRQRISQREHPNY